MRFITNKDKKVIQRFAKEGDWSTIWEYLQESFNENKDREHEKLDKEIGRLQEAIKKLTNN